MLSQLRHPYDLIQIESFPSSLFQAHQPILLVW